MHTKRLRIMSGLLAAAQRDISVTISDSTHQSHLLTLLFPHCMCAKAHFFKKQRAVFLSEWNIPERIIPFLFFFLIEQQSPPHFFLPFPHSILQISKCFHHLCLICLFPFFLNAVSESLATALYTRMNSCNLHCWCCNILQGYFH